MTSVSTCIGAYADHSDSVLLSPSNAHWFQSVLGHLTNTCSWGTRGPSAACCAESEVREACSTPLSRDPKRWSSNVPSSALNPVQVPAFPSFPLFPSNHDVFWIVCLLICYYKMICISSMICVDFPHNFVLRTHGVMSRNELSHVKKKGVLFPTFNSTWLTDTAREWERGWNHFNRVQGNG